MSTAEVKALARKVGTTHDGHPRYEVTINTRVVGFIEGHYPRFERRSPGKRYVNKRWQSKRRYWRVTNERGRTVGWAYETLKRALRSFELEALHA